MSSWCNTKYRRTERGCLVQLYHNMVLAGKRVPFKAPKFTRDEFIDWAYTNTKFKEQFKMYQESNYNKWYKPSVDRIDNFIGYEFSNMRIIAWYSNYCKMLRDKKKGEWV